jgi:pyridoxamine 5'-phosphate oxidase
MRRSELEPDPLRQFSAWLSQARAAGVPVPETLTLATAARDGRPSARQVLLKGFDERGFVFVTGYDSRKARELRANPAAALLFHWAPLGRQVRIEGLSTRVPRAEAEAYWRTRPVAARWSAFVSRQSEPIESREVLEARVATARASARGGEPPLPEHWGGYRVVPDTYEFWEHRDDRLHDRFRYREAGGAWRIERLSP